MYPTERDGLGMNFNIKKNESSRFDYSYIIIDPVAVKA